ncbi:MAG TPA: hypothetical protein VHX65_11460 [Pirellulales bacterium]|nr:hypothetical protein [Pirellulales bacterium]
MKMDRRKTPIGKVPLRLACWAILLTAALLTLQGCLPRGPISLKWPWRHGDDCPDCDADGVPVLAPHSMFNPVPTRPVFTPWMCDDGARGPGGTVAANRPSEKSLDTAEERPHDSELADRRPNVRAASARSSASDTQHPTTSSPSAADEYYNPSAESAVSTAPPSSPGGNQWHASNDISQ